MNNLVALCGRHFQFRLQLALFSQVLKGSCETGKLFRIIQGYNRQMYFASIICAAFCVDFTSLYVNHLGISRSLRKEVSFLSQKISCISG